MGFSLITVSHSKWSNSSWEVGRLGSQKAWGWVAIEDKLTIMTSQVHLAIKGIKDTPRQEAGMQEPKRAP